LYWKPHRRGQVGELWRLTWWSCCLITHKW
jgi:hypothetical protein